MSIDSNGRSSREFLAATSAGPTPGRFRDFRGIAASQILFGIGCLVASLSPSGMSTFWIFAALSVVSLLVLLKDEARTGGLMALAISVGFAAGPNNAATGDQISASVAICVLLVVALIVSMSFQKSRPVSKVLLVATSAFFLLQVFSTLLSGSSNVGLVLIRFVLPGLLIFVVGLRLGRPGMKAFADGLILLGVTQSAIAILEVLHLATPPYGYSTINNAMLMHPINSELVRAQAMLGHPIILSILLTVSFLLLVYRNKSMPVVVFLAGIVVLAAGLYLSGSRSAWLIGLLCVTFSYISERAAVPVQIFTTIALVAAVAYVFLDPSASAYVNHLWDNLSESGSYSHRIDTFAYALQLSTQRTIEAAVLGSGVASEVGLFNAGFLQQDGLQVVDNQFLTTLATIGLSGVAALLIICGVSLFRLRGSIRLAFISLCLMFSILDELRWLGPMVLFFGMAALGGMPYRPASERGNLVRGESLRRPRKTFAQESEQGGHIR